MIEIYVLGSGAAIPSKQRGHTSLAFRKDGEVTLFDCGENTQRRLIQEGLSIMKVKNIFISHYHADHVAGLIPLPQTMYLLDRTEPLNVYGPTGMKRFGKQIKDLINLDLGYDLNFHEVSGGKVYDAENYEVHCEPVRHTRYCLAYSFQEKPRVKFLEEKALKLGVKPGPKRGELTSGKDVKIGGKTIRAKDVTKIVPGKKIVYSGDTTLCPGISRIAKGADLLICESTFGSDKEKEAHEYGHLTAEDAARIAKEGGAKELMLIHFSPRYKKPGVLLEEAKRIFKNSSLAEDGMKRTVK